MAVDVRGRFLVSECGQLASAMLSVVSAKARPMAQFTRQIPGGNELLRKIGSPPHWRC